MKVRQLQSAAASSATGAAEVAELVIFHFCRVFGKGLLLELRQREEKRGLADFQTVQCY